MAVETTQNYNLLSQLPNFKRDNVEELYKNSDALKFYDIGHIVWVNPPKPSSGASESELQLYNNEKGGYIWTGIYVKGAGDNGTDGWVKFIDGHGHLLINGDVLQVDDYLSLDSTNPVQNKVLALRIQGIHKLISENQDKISQNSTDISTAQSDIKTMNTAIAENTSNIGNVKIVIKNIGDKVKENSIKINTNTEDIRKNQSDIADINRAIDGLQSAIHIVGIIERVSDLPLEGKPGEMYLVRENINGELMTNSYDEYLWIKKVSTEGGVELPAQWELVGSTSIDTSDLIKRGEFEEKIGLLTKKDEEQDSSLAALSQKDAEQDSVLNAHKTRLDELETPMLTITGYKYLYQADTNAPVLFQGKGNVICENKRLAVNGSGGTYFKSKRVVPSEAGWKIVESGTSEKVVKSGSFAVLDSVMAVPSEANFLFSAKNGYVGRFEAFFDNCSKSYSIYVVHLKYFGLVGANVTNADIEADGNIIKGLTPLPLSEVVTSYGEATLNNQKAAFGYPSYFGKLTSIKDANNFEIIGGFDIVYTTINEVPYTVYLESEASTTSKAAKYYFKQK